MTSPSNMFKSVIFMLVSYLYIDDQYHITRMFRLMRNDIWDVSD